MSKAKCLISEEDFDGLARGDVIAVSPLYEMKSEQWSEALRGPGEWTVVRHLINTVICEFNGQSKTLTREMNGRCVVQKKHITGIVSKSGNDIDEEPHGFAYASITEAARKNFVDDTDGVIRRMIGEGKTHAQIAARVGLSKAKVVQHAKRMGLSVRIAAVDNGERISIGRQILSMKSSGYSIGDIRKELGISRTTYYKYAKMAEVEA